MLHCRHSPGITGARSRWAEEGFADGARAQGLARPEREDASAASGCGGEGQVPKSPKGEASGERRRVGGGEGRSEPLPGFPSKI